MNNQIIPVFNGVINGESVMLCDARDLHEYLGVRRDFSTWVRGRIHEYKFVKDQDYILVSQNWEIKKGRGDTFASQNWEAKKRDKNQDYKVICQKRQIGHGRPKKDYHLTMDTAKELSMVERNEKGREARRYFIDFNSDAVLNSLSVLNTPQRADTAPVSHAAFLCPQIMIGQRAVHTTPFMGKTAGRLFAVLKCPIAPAQHRASKQRGHN